MIGLLCATPGELSVLISLLADVCEEPSPPGMRLVAGTFGGTVIVAVSAGIGKVPAAAAARFLLDRYKLDSLIVFGIAGALFPDISTGDLVLASELIPADVGVAHSGGFSITGSGRCEEERVVFHPAFFTSAPLLEKARLAARSAGCPVHVGKVITCDQIVLDPGLRAHLGELFGALAVEMEGAAAAHVANGDGVPFIAVRAISDELSHDFVGFENLLEYEGRSRFNLWHKRFRLAVTSPDTVSRVRGLSRGRDRAFETLTSFLRSYLELISRIP